MRRRACPTFALCCFTCEYIHSSCSSVLHERTLGRTMPALTCHPSPFTEVLRKRRRIPYGVWAKNNIYLMHRKKKKTLSPPQKKCVIKSTFLGCVQDFGRFFFFEWEVLIGVCVCVWGWMDFWYLHFFCFVWQDFWWGSFFSVFLWVIRILGGGVDNAFWSVREVFRLVWMFFWSECEIFLGGDCKGFVAKVEGICFWVTKNGFDACM